MGLFQVDWRENLKNVSSNASKKGTVINANSMSEAREKFRATHRDTGTKTISSINVNRIK